MEKYLGKITSAEFGLVEDYPFLIGLQLKFEFDSSVVYHIDKPYIVNMNNENNLIESISMVLQINKLLLTAGCAYISQLVGKPVEITLDDKGNIEDFCILTGVL